MSDRPQTPVEPTEAASGSSDQSLPPQVAQHVAIEDPTGRALQCSCGQWAMLYRNSFGLDAAEMHRKHAAFPDDMLVWVAERRRGMVVHIAQTPEFGDGLTWGDARRAYGAQACIVCWPEVVRDA